MPECFGGLLPAVDQADNGPKQLRGCWMWPSVFLKESWAAFGASTAAATRACSSIFNPISKVNCKIFCEHYCLGPTWYRPWKSGGQMLPKFIQLLHWWRSFQSLSSDQNIHIACWAKYWKNTTRIAQCVTYFIMKFKILIFNY